MKSALKIYKDVSVDDRKMSGYFNNFNTGLPIASDGHLLPFFITITSAVPLVVTEFRLQQIGSDLQVFNYHSLTNAWIQTTILSTYLNEYAYRGDQDILASLASYTGGVYRYSFKLGATQYYSGIFEINDTKTIITIGSGDFDAEEFDDDFF